MPYSGANDPSLPSKVKKMSESKRKKWVSAFNNALKSCTSGKAKPKDGGSCESYAFAVAYAAAEGKKKKKKSKKRSSIMPSFWETVEKFGRELLALSRHEQRAVSLSQIGNNVWEEMLSQGAFLNDLYFDEDGSMFAIASMGGKLFRSTITSDENGDVTIGELQEVVTQFEPVHRSEFSEDDGDGVRMLALSATTVINKKGVIDSRSLFDSMVSYMETTGKTIPRTFFHAGEQFKSGEIIHMVRDENSLITVTKFDDSELARREIEAREADPEYWGDSIEFDPVGDPVLHDVGDGIKIPVYEAGIPIAVSTLPAKRAASLYAHSFTLTEQEERMTLHEVQYDALLKMFGGDKTAVDHWLEENVDTVNRTIAETGQITRAEDLPETDEPVEEETVEEEEPSEEPEEEPVEEPEEEPEEQEPALAELSDEVVVEMDEPTMQSVADLVLQSETLATFQTTISEAIEGIQSGLAELTQTVGELQSASVQRAKEIRALKADEEAKKTTWLQDLPRNQRTVRVATFRPSEDGSEDPDKKPTMQEIAEDTLAKLE